MTAADRKPAPAAIANAPSLLPGLQWYFKAFLDLSTCRSGGGGIPWTAMHDWGRIHGITEDAVEFDRFVALMKAMDVSYSEFHKAKDDAENKKTAAQARRR
jgi:hypothetical protein